jgi:cold shock protein
MSYAFSYYGAETIPEGMIDPFAQRSSPTDAAARQRAVIAGTDQIGAIVKGIGGHLKLVYKVDNLSPIPERLSDLVRRVA